MGKPKLTWREPRWAYTRKLWSQLYLIINPASLCRITIATVVVSAIVVACFKWAVPQFVSPNLWPVLLAFPALLLHVVFRFCLLTLVRPTVTIRADKILVQHGETATVIDTKTVTATYLTFHANNRIRLQIHYTKNSKNKSRVIGVPPTVDFHRLSQMLPIFPVIRDGRNRSFTLQGRASEST